MTRFKYLALACLLGAAPAFAAHPGFVDLRSLEAHADASPTISVTLGEWMLELGGKALEEDPELAALSGLESMQVRVYEDADAGLVEAMASFAADLIDAGWQTVVSVRDNGDRVKVLMMPDGSDIAGLTVLIQGHGGEAVMVNAYGAIRPADLGRLISGIGEAGNVNLARASAAIND